MPRRGRERSGGEGPGWADGAGRRRGRGCGPCALGWALPGGLAAADPGAALARGRPTSAPRRRRAGTAVLRGARRRGASARLPARRRRRGTAAVPLLWRPRAGRGSLAAVAGAVRARAPALRRRARGVPGLRGRFKGASAPLRPCLLVVPR